MDDAGKAHPRARVAASAPVGRRGWAPFQDFLGPARRRTDHPLVVGVIVLCLGIMAVASLLQITATVWAGSQLKVLLDGQKARDAEVDRVRERLFKNTQAQGYVLRRLCLNTTKGDPEAQKECLAVGPPLSTTPSQKEGSN